MCTLTILRGGGKTLVTMNRDEARTRAEEMPIQRFARGPIAWAAPIDAEAMGTWMGANSSGLVACLMNLYGPEAADGNGTPRSRGAIVMACLARGGLAEAAAWAETSLRHEDYRPFRLALIDGAGGILVTSAGAGAVERRELQGGDIVLASSSWRTEEVIAWRERAFAEWIAGGRDLEGTLPSFHLAASGDDPRYSAMMAREESCTRSVTQAALDDGGGAALRYWPVRDRRIVGDGLAVSPCAG